MENINTKGSKYITLKEASKITGYSPDYLGQLIRKGKLAGKQVYLNVAWMTTEEAIFEYLEKNKTGGNGRAGLAKGFRSRFRRWVVNHSSGEEVIRMARRVIYVFVVALILFCLFLAYAVVANIFRVLRT